MKKTLLSLSFFILFANINSANALNIAIIETNQIIEKSIAMKKVKEEIMKQQKIYKDELSEEEEKVKTKVDKFQSQKSKLTEKAISKKEKLLQKEIEDLNELLVRRNKSLQKAEVDVMTKIGKKIEEILIDLKKEEKYDLILASDQVILYNKKMDISQEVLKKLNKELPKIRVIF